MQGEREGFDSLGRYCTSGWLAGFALPQVAGGMGRHGKHYWDRVG